MTIEQHLQHVARLTTALKALGPVRGLRCDSKDDPLTWTIFWEESPTPEQEAAAAAILAAYDPNAPTADDVRAEASRRMQALVGARDAAHLEIVIANSLRETARLQGKELQHLREPGQPDLTVEEQARAATLRQIDAAFEAIRAASNAMEASPPADYADDGRWP